MHMSHTLCVMLEGDKNTLTIMLYNKIKYMHFLQDANSALSHQKDNTDEEILLQYYKCH